MWPAFNKTIIINAPAGEVWKALTETQLMEQWMSETPINIITDWQVGGPFIIKGKHYKKGFENKGLVLEFEAERRLSYSHLSSLSRLPDELVSYSITSFTLVPHGPATELTVTLNNFPTEAIYKHLAFYWNVTIELFKGFVEAGNAQ